MGPSFFGCEALIMKMQRMIGADESQCVYFWVITEYFCIIDVYTDEL